MNDTFVISIVTFVYFFSAFVFLISLVFRRQLAEKIALWLAYSGIALHTCAIVLRWVHSYRLEMGHAPLANFYESLVFFSWSIVFIYILAKRRYRTAFIGLMSTFFSFLILAFAALSDAVDCTIQPLIPALQSNWLISHVMSSFLAYACFAIAFALSILHLVKLKSGNKREGFLPDEALLDEAAYRMISIGFVLLTIGIITGAAWADRAWGRYWGWDPKETWSLITWLIYGAFLHARLARGWKGTRMAVISIIGFACVIFTYLGVNYILSGLHSYL